MRKQTGTEFRNREERTCPDGIYDIYDNEMTCLAIRYYMIMHTV